MTQDATLTLYKCTRADGTDFRTGQVRYEVGQSVAPIGGVVDPADVGPCGRGLHLCETPRATIRFGNKSIDRGKWRWWECAVDVAAVVARDSEKVRVRAVRTVVRELTVADVLGADIGERVARCNAEAASWKAIPWFKPAKRVENEDVAPILARWHGAITPWAQGRASELVRCARLVRDASEARQYAAAAAVADAAAAVAAAAVAADAADAADAAADDDAAAAAADAAADAADAVADAVADAAAAAAAAADDAAVAADADAAVAAAAADWWYWRRWYVTPRGVLWRAARQHLAGLDSTRDVWSPMVDLYRLGCMPLGYCKVDGEVCFVIYAPEPR